VSGAAIALCRDWRDLAPEAALALVNREVRAWQAGLDWDVRDAWRVIEPARRSGQLPGFVLPARGESMSTGWTSFLLHHDCLQVMALVAGERHETQALVDAILESGEASRAASALFCVRNAAPGLSGLLRERGFRVEIYRYMVRHLDDRDLIGGDLTRPGIDGLATAHASTFRVWRDDTDAVAELCGDAYADSRDVRAFALHGDAAEWREYVAGLVRGPGCGLFNPAASPIASASDGRPELRAAAMVTTIGAGVAHLAQMAVRPACQGKGLGRSLVRTAIAAARRQGCRLMTLLVADSNTRARGLYQGLGFRPRSSFVVALADQPRVSTSFALATGGDNTRR
jgi:ribosomal protein S18 acetylase RimI-like enzyme